MKILRTILGIPCLAFILSGTFSLSLHLDATESTLPNDGEIPGTVVVGKNPVRILFDGTNIWVTNVGSETVTKLRASDGVTLGTFKVSSGPIDMAFDGTNIWITNGGSGKITKLRASDGAILGAFDTGTGPVTITFDGDYIWVANGFIS